jgi:hypothetical protein
VQALKKQVFDSYKSDFLSEEQVENIVQVLAGAAHASTFEQEVNETSSTTPAHTHDLPHRRSLPEIDLKEVAKAESIRLEQRARASLFEASLNKALC